MPPGTQTTPDSCDISDACDDLAVPAVRTGRFRPIWPGCPALLGRVWTLALAPAAGADPLPDVLAALAAIPAGDVALVDLTGRLDLQCWGGRTATAARLAGIAGVLVNGAVRDVAQLHALRFPTFALGCHPARARGRLAFVGAGGDVAIGADIVRAGWTVAADDSGAVFFPAQATDQVLARAREVAAVAAGDTERQSE